jgi:gamma-glutamyltranspeptidase/glutathione hydrolase
MRADRYREDYPTTGEVYLHMGQVPALGWRLQKPAWSSTFRRIIDAEIAAARQGAGRVDALQAARDAFYRGFVAEAIASFAASESYVDATGSAHSGLLEAHDLAAYETRLERPASVGYRGLDIHKCGPWTQGPVFLQQLRLLEGVDLAALGHNSPDYLHTLIESAKLAFADRDRWYGDPLFADVPLDRLLSTEYAAERRRLIDAASASGEFRPGDASAVQPALVAPDPRAGNGDTTHVDVADEEGNLFAATPSGGWLESSPVMPALGFPLGSRLQVFNLDPSHPNSLAPGKRPRTTLTPSLATRNGHPEMAFGTPGGDQQDQWTLQFLLNVVDFGMDLQAAIDAPLVHQLHFASSFYPHEVFPKRVVAEGRIPAAVVADLTARGHEVQVIGDWASGEVTAVRFDPGSGLIEGAASPRAGSAYAIGR